MIYDVTLAIGSGVPPWPGEPAPVVTRLSDMAKGDECNVTRMDFAVHYGTHLDAPIHFIPGGGDVAGLDLGILMGPCHVARVGDAVDAINKAQAQMALPQALAGSFQGTAQAFRDSLRTQPYLILAALVAVYIVLGLLYESYIHPLTILSTLPSAGIGALLILMAGGYDLSVIALIGIILLIGIVKKNGIMMVDFALTAERERGATPEDAIYQACMLRFRPIMMTTMCALLSGLPLMLGHGAGSELRRPLGYAMVGGLVLSQALTLFTTPVVYLYLDRAHHWYVRRKQARLVRKGLIAAPALPDVNSAG